MDYEVQTSRERGQHERNLESIDFNLIEPILNQHNISLFELQYLNIKYFNSCYSQYLIIVFPTFT